MQNVDHRWESKFSVSLTHTPVVDRKSVRVYCGVSLARFLPGSLLFFGGWFGRTRVYLEIRSNLGKGSLHREERSPDPVLSVK